MPVVKFGQYASVDSGTIIMWAGTVAEIPAGWVACDGANGTPDLTGQFLKSIPSATTDPGTTGGQSSQTLTDADLPSHGHTGQTNSGGSHDHPLSGSSSSPDANDGTGGSIYGRNSYWTSYEAPHSHTGTMDTVGAASPSAITNEPAYYELLFLMKT